MPKVTNGQFNLDNMKDQVVNWENYNNSKQAQWLYGKKLAQNLSQEGANVSVTVLHPGRSLTLNKRLKAKHSDHNW